MNISAEQISAVILAGGLGRRMGGADKGLLEYQGQALIEYVINSIQPQVSRLFISANRNQDVYARYGLPVLEDQWGAGQNWGPLAGIATALGVCETEYLLVVPCDTPNLPDDLVSHLSEALAESDADISVARDNERMHATIMLLRKTVLGQLTDFIESGERKLQDWIQSQPHIPVLFNEPGLFLNLNNPAELERLNKERKPVG